jgi:nucleotide-binding universal stress UspA family protein
MVPAGDRERRSIVVPVDDAPSTANVLPLAASLARAWDAPLVLTTVTSLVDESAEELEQLAGGAGVDDVRIEPVEGTDVVAAVAEVVSRFEAPLVCVATHARGRIGEAVAGSVTESLLREIEHPFVLVGPECAASWPVGAPRVLACLDGSPSSEAALAPAVEWAETLDLELWLAQVFHPLDVESARAPYEFLDVVEQRLRDRLPVVRACAAWSRDAAEEIVHLADALSVSVIAMSTHGRGGLARLALGSTTMAVVRSARCPVLTVRPR